MGRANAECQGKNGKWMCAGCTVQEGKRIDGEELLKIREAKHRNPRRMLKREKKKKKKSGFFFFLRKKYV